MADEFGNWLVMRPPVHNKSFPAQQPSTLSAGTVFIKKGVRLAKQMTGVHHERDRRAGTENVAGIVGLGRAAELARLHLDERRN